MAGLNFNDFGRQRKVNFLPKNELDKSTIVSVYPERIVDRKPTLFPGEYIIEAAPEGGFSLLVIGSASWFKEMEDGMPLQEIPTGSMVVAESVIRDYCNGLLGFSPNVAPGLFFIPGEWDKTKILTYKSKEGKTFNQLLDEAKESQKRWFHELVKLADTMWARTNGNPLSISKDARLAAEKLNLNKDWMQDFKTYEMVNCKACGHLVNPTYPVCSNCKNIVNEAKAKELGLKFAS